MDFIVTVNIPSLDRLLEYLKSKYDGEAERKIAELMAQLDASSAEVKAKLDAQAPQP